MHGVNQPADLEDELQQALRRMTGDFLDRLALQIPLLERFHADVRTLGIDADPSLIHAEAHKISGVARTLGFSEVGGAAAQLERATGEDLWTAAGFDGAWVLSCIQQYISELRSAQSSSEVNLEGREP